MNIEPLNTIGILGGMSSASTGEYYELINQKVKEEKGGFHAAEMILCSVNFGNIERFVRTENWEDAARYLAYKAHSVEKAGAVCLFLATNTMHRVREEIKAAITIPFIDIFETVSAEIRRQGKKKVGILGTYAVMSDEFYQKAYGELGVELVSPGEEEKRTLDRMIFDEMTNRKFLPATKRYFLKVIEQLVEKGAEGIILGCTEINMLISQEDVPGVPLFDTTTMHCELAAKICTGQVELKELDLKR